MRYICTGGARVVLCAESRCVVTNRDSSRGSSSTSFSFCESFDLAVFADGLRRASRMAMCRYCPQAEKWHLTKTWRAAEGYSLSSSLYHSQDRLTIRRRRPKFPRKPGLLTKIRKKNIPRTHRPNQKRLCGMQNRRRVIQN
jgi:hypothetical protein